MLIQISHTNSFHVISWRSNCDLTELLSLSNHLASGRLSNQSSQHCWNQPPWKKWMSGAANKRRPVQRGGPTHLELSGKFSRLLRSSGLAHSWVTNAAVYEPCQWSRIRLHGTSSDQIKIRLLCKSMAKCSTLLFHWTWTWWGVEVLSQSCDLT